MARYHSFSDGTMVPFTPEEEAARDAEEAQYAMLAEKERKNYMYMACSTKQNESCDANFYGLLMAAAAVGKANQAALGVKTQACIDWLDQLWGDYHMRKSDSENFNYDFSNHQDCPYGFLEVKLENV